MSFAVADAWLMLTALIANGSIAPNGTHQSKVRSTDEALSHAAAVWTSGGF